MDYSLSYHRDVNLLLTKLKMWQNVNVIIIRLLNTYWINNVDSSAPWRRNWFHNPWATSSIVTSCEVSKITRHNKCLRNEIKMFCSFGMLHFFNIFVKAIFSCELIRPARQQNLNSSNKTETILKQFSK